MKHIENTVGRLWQQNLLSMEIYIPQLGILLAFYEMLAKKENMIDSSMDEQILMDSYIELLKRVKWRI